MFPTYCGFVVYHEICTHKNNNHISFILPLKIFRVVVSVSCFICVPYFVFLPLNYHIMHIKKKNLKQ